MSGLARYFRRRGAEVAGYDRTPSELTNQLQSEGIDVQFNEDPRMIPAEFRDAAPAEVMVVRTPAVPVSSPLLKYWEERGARILKRADVLGMVTEDKRTVAVAGTHGKTTVSTMIAHLLTVGKVRCNAFLGGIAANYGTNVLLNDDAVVNVVEADEYDRSFLKLCPSESVITAMDPDHLDIYGTAEAMFDAYTQFAILCDGPVLVHERIAHHFKERAPSDDLCAWKHWRAACREPARGEWCLRVRSPRRRTGAGKASVWACPAGTTWRTPSRPAPSRCAWVSPRSSCVKGWLQLPWCVASLRDPDRRTDVVFIDDYAHHPKELDACIGSVREMYPGKRITGIFQPHLFTRTRDLASDFGRSLAALDELILLEIYPAREEPIPGITSQWLLDQVPMDARWSAPGMLCWTCSRIVRSRCCSPWVPGTSIARYPPSNAC
jgi:UDP-N-acetylmuramate--alanine ligase